MSEKTENGDWDENRKLVLRSLNRLEKSITETEHASKTRHDTVVSMLHNLEKELESKYVTKQEFNPISKAVYGMIGVILSGTLIAILGLVLTSGAGP